MGEVALKAETELAPVADMSSGLLDVIARATRDPNVDIDKMERLLAMQERVLAHNAKIAFIEAKIEMRPDLPVITERGKIIIRDKNDPKKIIQETSFARFEDLNEELMPIVTRCGFDITFRNGVAPDGKVRVYTILTHREGHSEETYFDLPHDNSGSKNSVQAIGSSTSYAKRYGMLAILNITTKGEDDDGQEAGGEPQTKAERAINAPHSSPRKNDWPAGPYPTKTAAMNAIRALKADCAEVTDLDYFEAMMSDYAAVFKQFEAANHSWWTGIDHEGNTFESIPEWRDRIIAKLSAPNSLLNAG